jgi:predicted nuclease of predicted toxin-antitoxin system
MVLITKDSDFRDSHFLAGTPSRLIRVTLGNLANDALIELFDRHWEALAEALSDGPCYVELGSEGVVAFCGRA